MNAARAVLASVLLLCSCTPKPAADASANDGEPAAASAAPTTNEEAPAAARGLRVGGKPIESITPDELTAAVGALGWKPPADLPPGVAVMRRADGGRESLTAVYDKNGARLNVMIVRAIPGETPSEGSTVSSAKSTYDAFHGRGKPSAIDGESAIVVVDMAIGVKGASKEDMQALFDAMVEN